MTTDSEDGFVHSGSSPQSQFEPLLTPEDAAKLFSIHPKTVMSMARRGELPAVRIGRYWRFHGSALSAWINAQSVVKSPRQSLTERQQ